LNLYCDGTDLKADWFPGGDKTTEDLGITCPYGIDIIFLTFTGEWFVVHVIMVNIEDSGNLKVNFISQDTSEWKEYQNTSAILDFSATDTSVIKLGEDFDGYLNSFEFLTGVNDLDSEPDLCNFILTLCN
jgi:hypothetical protein